MIDGLLTRPGDGMERVSISPARWREPATDGLDAHDRSRRHRDPVRQTDVMVLGEVNGLCDVATNHAVQPLKIVIGR
jgi:hypothetical protein